MTASASGLESAVVIELGGNSCRGAFLLPEEIMAYATGETPEVGDYVKNQWEQPGTVTRVHFAQDEEDLICIRWDDEGLKLLFSPASEYVLVFRKTA